MDEKERELYFLREKSIKDEISALANAEEKGIQKITNGSHPGCIMLLHAVSDTNTKILEEVIKTLQDSGYEFKSLNDLP